MKNMTTNAIIGTIFGDIVGSVFEVNNTKNYNFKMCGWDTHYTDDTVLTIATADWLAHGGSVESYYDTYGHKYPCGYGKGFIKWLNAIGSARSECHSEGNGSAMRVSPIGCYAQTIEDVLGLAETSAYYTHNTKDGIEGAKFVASAIFWIRKGCSKEQVKENLAAITSYNIDLKYDEIKDDYGWKYGATCKGTVPYAFIAFYESNSFEDAIRRAVSLGGDSDTIAAICGGMAAAYYGIPQKYVDFVCEKLPKEFLDVINQFDGKALSYVKKDK